ncbi:flagellar hook assembly protein FlgD [Salinicola halophilus]|uniref:flagellar hook assembly protein FlgD n=1 Tax=Salinicola halophilus TaxID=184065 RepID=UPI000DA21843|nr:flagellar hook assembly protein FlgD [Salinicola halophilus]
MASPVIGSNALANINGPAPAGSANGAAGTNSSGELNDRFMTLLVTQLKNQDPTSPMENSDMTAQLAQINTVSGIEKLNDNLSAITEQIDAGQTLQASALIGQGVMVPGSQILVGKTDEVTGKVAATPIGVDLDQGVEDMEIAIKGANGEVVSTFATGPLAAGVHSFTWDGKLADGSYASDNTTYSAEMTAINGEERTSAAPLNYALVNGVIQRDGGPLLDLGYAQEPVALTQVRQIL